jgi:hypothetical protein
LQQQGLVSNSIAVLVTNTTEPIVDHGLPRDLAEGGIQFGTWEFNRLTAIEVDLALDKFR